MIRQAIEQPVSPPDEAGWEDFDGTDNLDDDADPDEDSDEDSDD